MINSQRSRGFFFPSQSRTEEKQGSVSLCSFLSSSHLCLPLSASHTGTFKDTHTLCRFSFPIQGHSPHLNLALTCLTPLKPMGEAVWNSVKSWGFDNKHSFDSWLYHSAIWPARYTTFPEPSFSEGPNICYLLQWENNTSLPMTHGLRYRLPEGGLGFQPLCYPCPCVLL